DRGGGRAPPRSAADPEMRSGAPPLARGPDPAADSPDLSLQAREARSQPVLNRTFSLSCWTWSEVSSSEKHGSGGLPQLCRSASRPSDTQTALQRAIGRAGVLPMGFR